MSAGNATFHENNLVYAVVPQAIDDTTASSAWFPMHNAVRVTALVAVGATDIEVDAKIEQATDSSGTGAKDISGAAITQLTGTDDNKWVSIDVEATKFDTASDFDYGRLTITVGDGTTGATVGGFVILPTRHAPPTQIAAYAEQVVLAG